MKQILRDLAWTFATAAAMALLLFYLFGRI